MHGECYNLQDEQTNYQKQMDNVNSGVTFENENSFFLWMISQWLWRTHWIVLHS